MTQILQTTRSDHLVAWLAALSITIHVLESALPSPLPGVKPGLANVVTIVVLCMLGWRMAVWVSVLRVLGGSLLLGTFLSPTFLLSLSGMVCSMGVLGVTYRWSRAVPGWALGPIGYSVAAALAHMTGQFWMAYLFFIPHQGLLHLLPILLTVAVLFGFVSGVLANAVTHRIVLEPQ